MDKRFAIFLGLGLVVVAAVVFLTLTATQGNHLRLEGKILKVRTLPVNGGGASLVIVDFRTANPSDVPFMIASLKILLTPVTGGEQEGTTISKPEVDTIFQYQRVLGPKYNDVVSLRDRIAPHAAMDRMAGARFEMSEAAIQARKKLRLQFEDVDGAVAELTE